ncbi:TPA: hypothetical protein QEL15_002548 [Stenotrophomonas maltophilia]|nr:hypothetical protein [Stenotrophomonas maltophilia]
MLPDRWNPRLWLRKWLLKPSEDEIKATRIAAIDLGNRIFREQAASLGGSPTESAPSRDR